MENDNKSNEIVELLKQIRDNQKIQIETQTKFQNRVKKFQIVALLLPLPLFIYFWYIAF